MRLTSTLKGVAFEQFLDGFFKGDFGQYFTPREIIQFAVEMLEPTQRRITCLIPPAARAASSCTRSTMSAHEGRRSSTRPTTARALQGTGTTSPKDRLFGIEINDEIMPRRKDEHDHPRRRAYQRRRRRRVGYSELKESEEQTRARHLRPRPDKPAVRSDGEGDREGQGVHGGLGTPELHRQG